MFFVLQSTILLVSLSHQILLHFTSCNLRFFIHFSTRFFFSVLRFSFYRYIFHFFRHHLLVLLTLFLISPIADAPVCASAHEELLGALKHETLALKCEVDASPPADSFHWTFNSSGEPTDLSAKLQSSEVCCDFFLRKFFASLYHCIRFYVRDSLFFCVKFFEQK